MTHTKGILAAAVVAVFFMGASVLASAEDRNPGASLVGIQSSLRVIAQKVRPAVVEINVTEIIKTQGPSFDSPFDWFFNQDQGGGQGNQRSFRQSGLGSGIIVKRSGDTVYVLTNNHVVDKATEVSVRLTDGRVFKAKVVGTDPRKDIALVSFTTREKVTLAELGDSNELQVGDIVLAVGNPLGFESSVTMGMVSALGRRGGPQGEAAGYTDYIQTDAAINQGNSGGALVNIDGQVIGINTWIAAPSGGNVGLGFAIPINNARSAIDQFITKGRVAYGWLGALIGDAQDSSSPQLAADLKLGTTGGALVLGLYKGSPADKAGLQPGDVVTAVDSTQVADASQLTQAIGSLAAGKVSNLSIIRLGDKKTLSVKIGERDSQDAVAQPRNLWPGMTVLTINDQIREQTGIDHNVRGVVVASLVDQNTPAAIAGLKAGDVITAVNGMSVQNVFDYYKALNQGKGRRATFQIVRDGTDISIGL